MAVAWSHLSPAQQHDIEERAAILEFDAGLSRPDAERQAWELYGANLGHVSSVERQHDSAQAEERTLDMGKKGKGKGGRGC
jgi:hypothetical protein